MLKTNILTFLCLCLLLIKSESQQTADDFSRKPSEDFIKSWESMMNDFTPEDIKTFMIHSYETDVALIHEVLLEDVEKPFKGAFFIHNELESKAEIKIFNPKGKSLLKANENEGVFDFNCSLAGNYQIVILNREVE